MLKKRNLSYYCRQVSLGTCLFFCLWCYHLNAQIDNTFDAMLKRTLGSNDRTWCNALDRVSLNDQRMTFVEGSIGYDCLLRRIVMDNDREEEHITGDAYRHFLSFGTGCRKWGILGRVTASGFNADWGGKKHSTKGYIVSKNGYMQTESWCNIKKLHINGGFVLLLDSEDGSEIVSYKGLQPVGILQSRSFGLHSSIAYDCNKATMEITYENCTPFSVQATVFNNTGSAFRSLYSTIEENRITGTLKIDRKRFLLEITGGLAWNESDSTAEDSDLLLLGLKNRRYFFSGMYSATRGSRLKPRLKYSFNTNKGSCNGFDQNEDLFASIQSDMVRIQTGSVTIQPNTQSMFGVLFHHLKGSGTQGRCWYYPFTSWGLIVDLPDGIKLYNESIDFLEAGFNGMYHWNSWQNQDIMLHGSVTGLFIDGSVQYAKIERYAGLIPVYTDEKTVTMNDCRYMLGKAGITYTIHSNTSTTTIIFQQMVPLELQKNNHPTGFIEKPARSAKKRRLFGGFSMNVVVTLLHSSEHSVP